MAISEAMLAQALLEYLQQHAQQFETFLCERYEIGDSFVTWRADPSNKRLLVGIKRQADDMSTVADNEYGLRIERLY